MGRKLDQDQSSTWVPDVHESLEEDFTIGLGAENPGNSQPVWQILNQAELEAKIKAKTWQLSDTDIYVIVEDHYNKSREGEDCKTC